MIDAKFAELKTKDMKIISEAEAKLSKDGHKIALVAYRTEE